MNIDPGPLQGTLYVGTEQIRAALERGEQIVELTAAEASELAATRLRDRLARLEELRARPGRSKSAKRRARRR